MNEPHPGDPGDSKRDSNPDGSRGPTLDNGDSNEPSGRRFATTSWSMVLEAGTPGNSSSQDTRQALERLCQMYWYPLYAFVRRKGHSHSDAEELTQGFFAHLLDNNRLQLADQQKGRFRSFLLRSIENFIIQDWRKRTAQKRGGAVQTYGIDFQDGEKRYSREPASNLTPEKLFDRKWALQILGRVIDDLQEYYQTRNKAELFNALKPHLVKESTGSLRDIAIDLGMSEIAVKVAAHRMRQRYRAILCQMVGQTVDSDAGIDQEIADLFSALRGR